MAVRSFEILGWKLKALPTKTRWHPWFKLFTASVDPQCWEEAAPSASWHCSLLLRVAVAFLFCCPVSPISQTPRGESSVSPASLKEPRVFRMLQHQIPNLLRICPFILVLIHCFYLSPPHHTLTPGFSPVSVRRPSISVTGKPWSS